MGFLNQYWWLILLFLVGVIYNAIKDLKKIDYKKYVKNSQNKKDTDKISKN